MFGLVLTAVTAATLWAPAPGNAPAEDHVKVEIRGTLYINLMNPDTPRATISARNMTYELNTLYYPAFPYNKESNGKTCIIKGTLEKPGPGAGRNDPPFIVVQSFEFAKE
jgi:hypothetical protein